MFVDKVKVNIQAGDGGNGVVSFRHEKFVDRGGPDGGDGGNGGSVVFLATRNEDTLVAFRYQKQIKAVSGQAGSKRKKHGKAGEDLIVKVPVGTVVVSQQGETLADLTEDGQTMVVAKGGKGGFGNAHFISSTRQAPRVAEKGEKGDVIEATLELKMIADIGLVGLPNAGKSTLLASISNAKPEIANYPFTTLRPNLGVIDINKTLSLLVADIPGLIEGASKGKGLGDEFLRHVERTAVLIHLVDVNQEDVAQAYKTIQQELKEYQVDLTKRPQIVALNKCDGLDAETVAKKEAELRAVIPKRTKLFVISAQAKIGVPELLQVVAEMVTKARAKKVKAQKDVLPVITFEEPEERWTVVREGDEFVVLGKKLERFAARTDFGDYHSTARLRDILRKNGVMRELQRQNIEPDQKITIGKPPLGKLEY